MKPGDNDHGLRMARAGRRQLGAFARDHVARRQEAVLRASGGHWRRRRILPPWRCQVMRAFVACRCILAIASESRRSCRHRPPPRAARRRRQRLRVPRASDGKPDLTGVWQGGSTQRGTWEEANTGRRRRRQRARSRRRPWCCPRTTGRPGAKARRISPGPRRKFWRPTTSEASTIRPRAVCRRAFRER